MNSTIAMELVKAGLGIALQASKEAGLSEGELRALLESEAKKFMQNSPDMFNKI